jgi:hypothetical protein
MKRSSSNVASSGIVKRYKDALGNWRKPPAETCDAIVAAME